MSILWVIAIAAAPQISSVQLPNPGIFGRQTSEPVKLLVDKKAGDSEPYVVWSDIRCGYYFAASAFYRAPVEPDVVKAAISARYGEEYLAPGSQSVPAFGLWRVDSERFSIQLATHDDAGSQAVRVTFIRYHKPSLPKLALQTKGVERELLDDMFGPDECIDFEEGKAKYERSER